LVLLLPSLAGAQKGPSAEQVLERARTGRVEMLLALSDMERFSPVAERKEEVYPYVLILDELDEIGQGYDLESFGMNPVEKTGALITRHAAKWIHFTHDDWELLSAFYKWAEDSARFATVDQQSLFIWRTDDLQELLKWHELSVRIVDQLTASETVSPYILKSFESLQADLAKRILTKRDDLTEDEFLAFATGTTARPVIEEISDYLHNAVIDTTDADSLRELLRWTMTFGRSLKDRDVKLPSHLEKLTGQICLEAITKLAYQGRPADVEIVDDLLEIFSGTQFVELTSMLAQLAQGGCHPEATEFLAALGRKLVQRARQLGLRRIRIELERAAARLVVAQAIHRYPLAGLYRCGDISITLFKKSDVSLCLGITLVDATDPAASVDVGLCRVLYDLETDEFVGYQYVVRDPYEILPLAANARMRFTVKEFPDGLRIEGQLALGTRIRNISAKQVRDFSLPVADAPPLTDYTGTYTGTMNGHPLQLVIGKTNSVVTGWAVYTHQRIRIDFPFAYFAPERNAIYLTTEYLVPTNVKHLNGVLDAEGNLRGEFIVGGTGKILKVQLRKQQETFDAKNPALVANRDSRTAVRRAGDRGGPDRQGL
jgi:hypothetical protein